ncbi:hypothetical protein WCLP8_4710003 [uncultured Gammaproteobacteria bacterium]
MQLWLIETFVTKNVDFWEEIDFGYVVYSRSKVNVLAVD